VQQRDDRNDGRGQCAEADERDGAFVSPLAARHHERGEKERRHDQRADGEEDDVKVVERMRLERRVGREEHVGPALKDQRIDDQHAQQHQREGEPAQLRRRQARAQQDRAREVEHGHLDKDDEEGEHVEAVQGQEAIEEIGGQEVHGLPAGHHDADSMPLRKPRDRSYSTT